MICAGLKVERDGPVVVVTLDRPPMNALDAAFCDAITAAFESLPEYDSVGAAVLTGNGSAFSAGVDLKAVPDLDTPAQDELMEALNRMVLAVYGARIPVIAAVNGHAIAGGIVLAACVDRRIAAPAGRHGLTEVAVGVRFPAATLEAVLAEFDARAVRRLAFGGDLMTSAEAEAIGVYDEVADDPLERALEVAHEWAARERSIYADVKTAIRGRTLARMKQIVDDGDPLKGQWLSAEMRELARAHLAR